MTTHAPDTEHDDDTHTPAAENANTHATETPDTTETPHTTEAPHTTRIPARTNTRSAWKTPLII